MLYRIGLHTIVVLHGRAPAGRSAITRSALDEEPDGRLHRVSDHHLAAIAGPTLLAVSKLDIQCDRELGVSLEVDLYF